DFFVKSGMVFYPPGGSCYDCLAVPRCPLRSASMILRLTPTKQSTHRREAAAVEFALIVPYLLLILFGIIEFSRMWLVIHTLGEVARQGCHDACTMRSGTTATVVTDCQSRASYLLGCTTTALTVNVYVDGTLNNSKDVTTMNTANYSSTSGAYSPGSK